MDMHVPPVNYSCRWFCYLDILGFSRLVESEGINGILASYEKALRHAERGASRGKRDGISYSWFSDTFILYSSKDTAEDFARVESAGRVFFQTLIQARIPVRGAISCGEFYSQKERNVFIGRALIDSHCYGEKQRWLGFVLTPSAVARMSDLGLDVRKRAFYKPVPAGVFEPPLPGPVWAYAFNNAAVNGESPFPGALMEMRQAAPQDARAKYKRTLRFIRQHA
jgi:hypothetical protein